MKQYDIIFKPSVEKDLHNLSKELILRVMKKIENLSLEPFPRETVKLSSTEQLYRVRVGKYRVVYEVDTKSNQIVIHYVGHRRDVYRRL